MTQHVTHAVLTRWSLMRRGVSREDAKWRDPNWIRHRLALFRRFLLPSMRGQTNNGFKWLILVDPETPHVGTLEDLVGDDAAIVGCEGDIDATVFDALGQPAGKICTTRIDSDDAISRRFMAQLIKLAAVPNNARHMAFNFTNGAKWWRDRAQRYSHRSNPFVSYLCDSESFRTVFAWNHGQVARQVPTVQIKSNMIDYLIVCHGQNELNAVRTSKPPEKWGFPERRLAEWFDIDFAVDVDAS